MERLVELVELVVEVVADLVQQRAKEGAELHDVLLLRGAHPHSDPREVAGDLVGLVQALQLVGGIGRTPLEHLHDDARRSQLRIEGIDQALAGLAHARDAFRGQCRADRDGCRHQRGGVGELDAGDALALAVGAFSGRGELVVVREWHGRISP